MLPANRRFVLLNGTILPIFPPVGRIRPWEYLLVLRGNSPKRPTFEHRGPATVGID